MEEEIHGLVVVRQKDPLLLYSVYRHAAFFGVVGRALEYDAFLCQGFRLYTSLIQIGNVQTA